MLERFKRICALQDGGRSWRRPEDVLREVGLYGLTQDSMLQFLRESIGSTDAAERFSSEVVAGASLVNYGQSNGHLNALAGLVSMLPSTGGRGRGGAGSREGMSWALPPTPPHPHAWRQPPLAEAP